jgi:hypothetical protein
MVNVGGIARLGTLAVGLGIGAAWAHTPIASADTSGDAASTVDSLLSGASPAPAAAINLDISFDGYTLYDGGGSAVANTGAAGNGLYDFAIAYGDGAYASAEGGTADYALASGTDANAEAGSLASGATGNNFDSAVDIGNNTRDAATTGAPDGAYAGGGSLIGGTDSATNSNDTAIDIGNNGVSTDTSFPGDGGNTGAFAGDGQLIGASGAGNGDTAINLGNDNGFGDGPAAVAGTGDSATTSGDETGTNIGALAGFGNNDIASVIGGTSSADAGGEYGTTILGNNDIATVFDPTGALGSTADAGANSLDPGNFDLASVFGDGLNATAQGANFLFDILPSL